MKFEKRVKLPGGLWKDGVIATRPLGDSTEKTVRPRNGKAYTAENAQICLNCTRKRCNGKCKKIEEGARA